MDVARNVLRVDRASKHDFVRGELGWMRLSTRRHQFRLRYLWRLLTMSPTRWPARLFRLSLGFQETGGDLHLQNDWLDRARVAVVPNSWFAATLRLLDSLQLATSLIELYCQHKAALAPAASADDKRQQDALAKRWTQSVNAALEFRDTQHWIEAIGCDKRLRAYAAMYIAVPSAADGDGALQPQPQPQP